MAGARYWREIQPRYNFIGDRCGICGKVYFPGRLICPTCHRESLGKMERKKLSGKGEVVSFTVVHEAPSNLENQVPYVLAIIQLEEGVRLTAQIIDCETSDIKMGMKVRAVFRRIGQEGDAGVINYGFKFVPEETGCAQGKN